MVEQTAREKNQNLSGATNMLVKQTLDVGRKKIGQIKDTGTKDLNQRQNWDILQEWSSQSPHRHGYTDDKYPGKGLDHNYCRNPAEKYSETWCYTTDPNKRWDWCVVPDCDDELKFDSATQKSIGWGGAADRAIDGNTNGLYSNGNSCTHSADHEVNWWNGKLSKRSAVSRVLVHNRIDCCSNRIDSAQVYVDDTLCGAISYEVGKVVYEVDCGGAVGNNIIVRQNGEYLTLCEVQAIGVSSPGQ